MYMTVCIEWPQRNLETGNQGNGAALVTVLNQLCEPAGLMDWRDGLVTNGLPTTSVLGQAGHFNKYKASADVPSGYLT